MDRNLFPLSVTVRSGRSKHTHTHISVCDLSQCHASTDSIRGEPLFFSYLWFYFFRFSFSLSHAHNLSQQEPNNFSLNATTALTVDLNTDLQGDRTQGHAPITFWEHAFCPQKEGESPQSVGEDRKEDGRRPNQHVLMTNSSEINVVLALCGASRRNVPAM